MAETATGRIYKVFIPTEGRRANSIAEAWRLHNERHEGGTPPPPQPQQRSIVEKAKSSRVGEAYQAVLPELCCAEAANCIGTVAEPALTLARDLAAEAARGTASKLTAAAFRPEGTSRACQQRAETATSGKQRLAQGVDSAGPASGGGGAVAGVLRRASVLAFGKK